MRTHNRMLCHCQHCGRVVHLELYDLIPECCGQRMVLAATETVAEMDTDSEADTFGERTTRLPARQIPIPTG